MLGVLVVDVAGVRRELLLTESVAAVYVLVRVNTFPVHEVQLCRVTAVGRCNLQVRFPARKRSQ